MTSSCICAEVLIMNRPRLPRDRVPYSAIIDRPALVLPDDARMIVWTIVNVEDWGIERPMPQTSTLTIRSEEHTSELQSLRHLVCRLLLEKKKKRSDARTKGAPAERA